MQHNFIGRVSDLMQERDQPICPKCGYDQSGEIATWEAQCPVHGVCPECGLDFEWADIFDPDRIYLSWYIEHATRKRSMLWRTPRTLAYLLIPNRFWRRLGVEREIRMARLWVWAGTLVAIFYAASVLMSISLRVMSTLYLNAQIRNANARSRVVFAQSGVKVQDMTDPGYWIQIIGDGLRDPFPWFAGPGRIGYLMAMMMLGTIAVWVIVLRAVPTTRRLAKLRYAHVLRAAVLSVGVAVLLLLFANIAEHATIVELLYRPRRFAAQGSNPVEVAARLMMRTLAVVMLIWLQWFWIAAFVIGWRIRSFVLLILALLASSLGGLVVYMYLTYY
ncbi:MAG: hypothetical protein ACX94C_00330 [Phycisphaerales bacterium]